MAKKPIVAAHDQKTTIHLLEHIEGHMPRAADPFYHFFHKTVTAMRAAHKDKCFVANHQCAGLLEWHHCIIEFSMVEAACKDITVFQHRYPQYGITTPDGLREWAESEANMLVLCKAHHTGKYGIHEVDYPLWVAQTFLSAAAAEVIAA